MSLWVLLRERLRNAPRFLLRQSLRVKHLGLGARELAEANRTSHEQFPIRLARIDLSDCLLVGLGVLASGGAAVCFYWRLCERVCVQCNAKVCCGVRRCQFDGRKSTLRECRRLLMKQLESRIIAWLAVAVMLLALAGRADADGRTLVSWLDRRRDVDINVLPPEERGAPARSSRPAFCCGSFRPLASKNIFGRGK